MKSTNNEKYNTTELSQEYYDFFDGSMELGGWTLLEIYASEINEEVETTSNCTSSYYITPTELRINQHYLLCYINISNLIIYAFVQFAFVQFIFVQLPQTIFY